MANGDDIYFKDPVYMTDDEMAEYEKIFTPQEIAAVEAFIESIQPELDALGPEGELTISWDQRKIVAKADNGAIKEWDFSHIMKHLIGSELH